MNKQETYFQDMKIKIQEGLKRSYVRLLKEKIKNKGELVVMRDDKIVVLKTSEIKKILQQKKNLMVE
ncbi:MULTISPECIES: hypothetical protein [Capnocytophaga]|uniref:Uncharacterized protein n=1 Tax=Capnocytophaga canis TaxID=1848903 RepID=A0A0B7IAJ5_9FLAO|nr:MULTISPECIES: hypothetical protein [Capnocytophaga]ATA72454.1 hypothetical protein CGC49_03535 [Capnocytophaga sp. H4358]ATA74563.1 hypothetical protein CGC52_03380 [Capnocytophaga sp. H2931]RIY35753.1 hypothetical protein CKY20_09115 [Capnocytophaga canis]CEN42946.1 hypothetical protein CCAND95_190013 [Capnocytophaga canis]CEN47062.1 hypothetical protein CCAND38_420008 [Capnocytophaga canis]